MALDDLAGLLRRWQQAGSGLDRARVVAHGAELLRGLSAEERRALGQAVGDQALTRTLDRLDPHLPGVADPASVERGVERLLDADPVTTGLAATDVPAEAPAPEPPAPPPEPPAPPPEPATPPAEPAMPTPESSALTPEPATSTEALPRHGLPPVSRPTDPPRAEPGGRADRLARQAGHALDRLRQLDDVATAVAERDVLALLEQFPDGWQRRRAVDRLLDTGVLVDVDPERLLSLFARDGDRNRIAAALLSAGLLDAAGLARLVRPAVARRLTRRLAAKG